MKGKKNVHDWIEEKLLREVHNDAIIVKDHGPGEIADFVIIEPKKFLISFLHCKGTRGGTPGDRVKDAYEVLGQACRTSQRITKDLLNDLTTQTKPPRSSPYIRGDSTILERLAIKIGSNKWKYRAVVVQPGFRCGDVARSKKINALLVATYEWLSNASVDFRVWGS